jgi:hypothetical protein
VKAKAPRSGPPPTPNVSWNDVLQKALNDLPRSLGEARKERVAKGEDPLPFTYTSISGTNTLFIPDVINTEDNKIVRPSAMILKLAQMAGIELQITKREVKTTFWNSFKALNDAIEGLYHCLSREEISPLDNIPKEFKLGWDFALWYAYVGMSKDYNGGRYLSITKQTSLSGSSGTAWTSNESLADLNRLTSTLRTIAMAHGSIKPGKVKKFFRNKGYFLQAHVGKRPSAGLYHTEELPIVSQNWEERVAKVSKIYDKIPESFNQLGPGEQVSSLMREFNIENSSITKKIEESRIARIPELLVDAPRVRGQKPQKTIAKGSGLPEKLLSLQGGESVRTIGKVMWSPIIMGYNKNQFIDLTIKEVNGQNQRGKSYIGSLMVKASNDEDEDLEELLKGVEPFVAIAAQTYLEILPDRRGNPAWDAVFPPSK